MTLNKTAHIHINLDTGMNRLGVKNTDEFISILKQTKRLIPHGVMTHLVSSNNKDHVSETTKQLAKFKQYLSYFKSSGLRFRYQHVMNSNGVINHNTTSQANTIRPGLGLYYPCSTIRMKHPSMKPIFEYWGKIINIQTCQAGESIGYGFCYRLKNNAIIAVVSVGYSDGVFQKKFKNTLSVNIDGVDCPIVGLTCMDCCFVDITKVMTKPYVGQYVQVTSTDPRRLNYIDHYLNASGKSHHEFLCGLSQRSMRIEKRLFDRSVNHR